MKNKYIDNLVEKPKNQQIDKGNCEEYVDYVEKWMPKHTEEKSTSPLKI